ncbi:unnamed protein product, partial [Sphacelaria rigidula]
MDPRKPLWWSGGIIFVLAMGTAFPGHVLPWGAIRFWGVSVITSTANALPYQVGRNISWWIWGAYVNNKTLTRFSSLHYLLPFLFLGFVLVHLGLWQKDDSNDLLSVKETQSNIRFKRYLHVKDILGFFVSSTIVSGFIIYAPIFSGDLLNYTPPNPTKTPAHFVPEWHFLADITYNSALVRGYSGYGCCGESVIRLSLIKFFKNTKCFFSSNIRCFSLAFSRLF